MNLLLDTHVLLWWLAEPARIAPRARSAIASAETKLYWSAASTWELAIKLALGRVSLPEPLETFLPARLEKHLITELPITNAHAFALRTLPPIHRDPFDRMLVAQARSEGIALCSADPKLRKYGIEVVWKN